jgi:beta-galactosidase/beta-glucuronidase
VSVELGANARLWWDDDPFLYGAAFRLLRDEVLLDTAEKRVGLREFTVSGRQMLLNGVPTFLRGYVDCCIFPLTGYPSWDVEHYRHQFRVARSYGFNHVRLHSWTAPEPFWQAADELGMLVQTELPNWTHHYGHSEVAPPADLHHFLIRELEQIVDALQLHPSWVMFSNGNELIYDSDGHPGLFELASRGKELDPTRLFTDQTGFGQLPTPNRDVDYYIQSCNWHPPAVRRRVPQHDRRFQRRDGIRRSPGDRSRTWAVHHVCTTFRGGKIYWRHSSDMAGKHRADLRSERDGAARR